MKVYNSYLSEKLAILLAKPDTLLNKGSELIAKCRHRNKLKLIKFLVGVAVSKAFGAILFTYSVCLHLILNFSSPYYVQEYWSGNFMLQYRLAYISFSDSLRLRPSSLVQRLTIHMYFKFCTPLDELFKTTQPVGVYFD